MISLHRRPPECVILPRRPAAFIATGQASLISNIPSSQPLLNPFRARERHSATCHRHLGSCAVSSRPRDGGGRGGAGVGALVPSYAGWSVFPIIIISESSDRWTRWECECELWRTWSPLVTYRRAGPFPRIINSKCRDTIQLFPLQGFCIIRPPESWGVPPAPNPNTRLALRQRGMLLFIPRLGIPQLNTIEGLMKGTKNLPRLGGCCLASNDLWASWELELRG